MNGRTLAIPVRKRLRFREEDDVALLREVAGQNPFTNPELWKSVQEHVFLITGKTFSIKTLKDHLDLLIKLWLQKTKLLIDKSGIEEDYSEKDQLCQNIYDYMAEYRGKVERNAKKKKAENLGKIERDQWANTLVNNEKCLENVSSKGLNDVIVINTPLDHQYCSDLGREEIIPCCSEECEPESINISAPGTSLVFPSTSQLPQKEDSSVFSSTAQPPHKTETSKVLRPIKARKRKLNVQRQGLSYLEEYDKTQNEIKRRDQFIEERKLAIEERKLALTERKLQLEENQFASEKVEKEKQWELSEKRLQHDIDKNKELHKIIERQDKIINSLLLCSNNACQEMVAIS